jgi:hypothetical protein
MAVEMVAAGTVAGLEVEARVAGPLAAAAEMVVQARGAVWVVAREVVELEAVEMDWVG